MLIIITGYGKGKTTASLGQAMRMVGRGKRVLMIQFIKGPWKSGEDFVNIKNKISKIKNKDTGKIIQLKGHFEIRKRGLGFVGILDDKLPREDHAKAAQNALAEFAMELKKGPPSAKASEGAWDCIILDEINNSVMLGLVGIEEVLKTIENLPPEHFVIFTGRDAPKEFIARADLVSEVREIKHPFNDGVMAKAALEF